MAAEYLIAQATEAVPAPADYRDGHRRRASRGGARSVPAVRFLDVRLAAPVAGDHLRRSLFLARPLRHPADRRHSHRPRQPHRRRHREGRRRPRPLPRPPSPPTRRRWPQPAPTPTRSRALPVTSRRPRPPPSAPSIEADLAEEACRGGGEHRRHSSSAHCRKLAPSRAKRPPRDRQGADRRRRAEGGRRRRPLPHR